MSLFLLRSGVMSYFQLLLNCRWSRISFACSNLRSSFSPLFGVASHDGKNWERSEGGADGSWARGLLDY